MIPVCVLPLYSDCLIYPPVAFALVIIYLLLTSLDPLSMFNFPVRLSSRQNVDLSSVPIFLSQSIVILYTTPFDSRFQFCLALVCNFKILIPSN